MFVVCIFEPETSEACRGRRCKTCFELSQLANYALASPPLAARRASLRLESTFSIPIYTSRELCGPLDASVLIAEFAVEHSPPQRDADLAPDKMATELSSTKVAGGTLRRVKHASAATKTDMTFAIFTPAATVEPEGGYGTPTGTASTTAS